MGKRLGIGVRVAGRIAQQRAAESAASRSRTPASAQSAQAGSAAAASRPGINARAINQRTGNLSRAAGRGIGGFLRPFGRVGGILWLEVTGFFFGLFALYFATDVWRTRLSFAAGPQHTRFLIAVAMTLVFGYLCISAYWRAHRR